MAPTRIYVAGPMSGLPDYNLPAFADAAERLTAAGFEAVNPGRHGVSPGWEWEDYLRRGLAEMLTCDGVALLPGWEDSRGAPPSSRPSEPRTRPRSWSMPAISGRTWISSHGCALNFKST